MNQPVAEYWFDPHSKVHASLTAQQQALLDELIDEFEDCIGDTTSRAKQRAVPYVRLPVREDYVPCSDPPFKRNPKVTKLTIGFIRDLEK